MAKRKIYFYVTEVFDENGCKLSQKQFKDMIVDILNKYGSKQEDHISIDITPYHENMHMIFDAYNYEGNKLFGRFSKQLPKNSLVHHNYHTYKDSEVLPGVDEKISGIEKYTYGMVYYETGIWAFISAQGAVSEKALKLLIEKYRQGYTVEITPIPNENGIEKIYEGKKPEISKVEIEVPLPNAVVLEQLYGWHDEQLLECLNDEKLKITTVLKSEPRSNITDNPGIVQKIIDAIKGGKESYNKAKMVAKAQTVKAREYNFFDDYFMYPIDVASYHMQNNERVYYTPNELVDIYRQNIIGAVNDSRGILNLFGNGKN